MGAWGTGLFSNDTAADLRDDFKLYAGLPWPPEKLTEVLAEQYGVPPEGPYDDADQTGFWLALADLYHAYRIDVPEVFEKARAVIADGSDLALLRELDMSNADLKRRAQLLDGLPAKWSTPPEKPKKIKPLKPEAEILAAGDLVAYPTMSGDARRKPYLSQEIETYRFEQDATNVFIVLAVERVFHDMFVKYFIAPLVMFGRDEAPALSECIQCYFMCEIHVSMRTFEPVGDWASISKRDLNFMGGRKIANVPLNVERVETFFPALPRYRGQWRHGSLDLLRTSHTVWDDVVRCGMWGELEDNLSSFIAEVPEA
ncbi:MAG: hypothetical protein AAFV19_11090 [Pseudomonadota bacterium]